MSTINNIPFDINRTPSEANATRRPTGTAPVFSTAAIKQVEDHAQNPDRRSGDDRRKRKFSVVRNKRNLIKRRESLRSITKKQEQLANAHKSGHIIDLEV